MDRHYHNVPRFLRSCKSAWRWAVKNIQEIGDAEYKARHKNDEGYSGAVRDQFREWACEYSEFAKETYRVGRIKVYRAIRVETINEIRWNCIGKSWSFTEKGAGIYGNAPSGGVDIIIEAEVEPKDIDWEYGFTSYMYYGSDQSEVSLLKHSSVLVSAIDGQILEEPINANTGECSEMWDPTQGHITGER